MKIYKYYGNNKDPWYLQHPWNWWSKILIALIRPKLACNECKTTKLILMGIIKDNVYCKQCYELTKKYD